MDLFRLQKSLVAVQLVGAATLFRSIAFDRWITVLASVLLLVGATAALRGRSWGVLLALGAAVAFPVAWALGIAPGWFTLVGAIGSLPFLLASKAFARFDRSATVVLGAAAAAAGTLGAVLWKEYAWSVFTTFPSLMPSVQPQHASTLLALVAASVIAMRVSRSKESARLRVAEHDVRVEADEPLAVTEEELFEERDVREPRRASR